MSQKEIGPPQKEYPLMKGYWFGTKNSAPSALQEEMAHYKEKYLKNMVSLYPDDLQSVNAKRNGLRGSLTVSIKRDGMFTVLSYERERPPESLFCNTSGRAIFNLPVTRQIQKALDGANGSEIPYTLMQILAPYRRDHVFRYSTDIFQLTVPGEMIAVIDKHNFRPRVSDLMKLLLNPSSMEDLRSVHFEPFDLISINTVTMMGLPYAARLDLLNCIFPRHHGSSNVHTVKYFRNRSLKTLLSLFNHYVLTKNQEGLVIRNSFGQGFKLKRVYEMDAVIIGFTMGEADGRLKGQDAVSTLLTALMDKEGRFHVAAKIKAGFKDKQRVELYRLLSKDIVPSRYETKSESSGKRFTLVKPNYVVQVRFLDLLRAECPEDEVKEAILVFNENRWTIHSYLPAAQFINPWFDMFRSAVDSELYPSLKCANPKSVLYSEVKREQLDPILLRSEHPKYSLKEEIKSSFEHGDLTKMYAYIREGQLSDENFTQEEIQELYSLLKLCKKRSKRDRFS